MKNGLECLYTYNISFDGYFALAMKATGEMSYDD